MLDRLIKILTKAKATFYTSDSGIALERGELRLPRVLEVSAEVRNGKIEIELTPPLIAKDVAGWWVFSADAEIRRLTIDQRGVTADTNWGEKRLAEFDSPGLHDA